MRATQRALLLVASLLLIAPLHVRAPLSLAQAATRTRPQTYSARALRPEGQSLSPESRQKFLRRILPKLGSHVAFRKVAGTLGVTEFRGKRLDLPPTRSKSQMLALDQPVDSFDLDQNEPSIAVNPVDNSVVVVFAHNEANFTGYDNACSIYVSFDAGVSFTYADDAPLLNTTDTCADPVVRYSPDGTTVYYSYLSIRDTGDISDSVVTTGDGSDPASFVTGPTTVIPGLTDFIDKPWLGVHTFDAADGVTDGSGQVYVITTAFFSDGTCGLVYNLSSDYGASWTFANGFVLPGSNNDCNVSFLHGARIEGGPGQQVLACYYNSGADGYSPDVAPPALSGRFHVSCVSSGDRWVTTSPQFNAAANVGYELNYYLGPNESYHRWFGGMFPALAIDHRGTAHIAFTVDPTASKVDNESGNVQTTRNTGGALNPPYTGAWTARLTIGTGPNTGPRAQGYPTIVAQRSNLTTHSYIYIAYYDHYRSPGTAPNLLYDVRYRRSINSGGSYAAPITVTDVPSLSDFEFIGDYFDSAANMRRYHLVWTDRADKTSIMDLEDDIYADRF
jgi:hypothetical protein